MKRSFLIFEPHGDDALISCNELLRNIISDHHVRFVTLSERSSERYSLNLGIQDYIFLDLPEVNVYLKSKVNTHDYHKAYLRGEDTYRKYLEEVYLGQEPVNSRVEEVKEENKLALSKVIKEFHETQERPVVVYNLGFDHPYHVLVSELISEIIKDYPRFEVIRYGDKPYLSKRYVREMIEHHPYISKGRAHSLFRSIEDQDTKLSNFLEFYPTEKGLLRFTKESIISDPDFYVSRDILLEEIF